MSKGFHATLFAAEPLVANPVAFGIDERNRLYVCETFRQHQGVEDNRDHAEWVNDDLASKSIEDRMAIYRKHLGDDLDKLTKHQDRIRLLLDRNEDGRADKSIVFAGGFDGPLEGTGAGVLSRHGTVYYACIPRLWAFRDNDKDGKADRKFALHEGYGVRVAFSGHDLHGLCAGPDGRLYFSIGDRGFHVKTPTGTIANAETGAVFRCEFDGSDLEIFATGFRNPQDLEFDDMGNLFTGDNNSDGGDLARWLHVVRDADYGWRMAYQYMPNRGPWNRERMWEPRHGEQPAYIMPPVANIGDGPSGIAYYPGTGMTESYRGNFFLCDFRGEAGMSGIRTFKMQPDGASFQLIDPELFVWNCLPTDVQFGTDGALFISDWVEGWSGTGKGRIFRVTHSSGIASKGAREVHKILRFGMGKATAKQLSRLLGHPDRRLRLEAQFQLVDNEDVATLARVAHSSRIQLARLHGTWGLGRIARRGSGKKRDSAIDELVPLISDTDEEIRHWATLLVAEAGHADAKVRFLRGLKDQYARVRYASAMALAMVEAKDAVEPVVAMLASNNDVDATIRHAGVMALYRCALPRRLRDLSEHPSRAVRLAAVLALRRHSSASVAAFLDDNDPWIVTEAARAIYDTPIPAGMERLADLKPNEMTSEPLALRILAANARLGGPKHAETLAQLATDATLSLPVRTDAVSLLADWTDPSPRDFVTGMWRPVNGNRDKEDLKLALQANLTDLLDGDYEIRLATAQLAAALKIEEASQYIRESLQSKSRDANERAGALLALAEFQPDDLPAIVEKASQEEAPEMRAAARIVLFDLDEEAALRSLWDAVRKGSTLERQSAIELLANGHSEKAKRMMLAVARALIEGKVPDAIRLDIYEASRSAIGSNPSLEKIVSTYEERWDNKDKLAPYRDMLVGGDAERGKKVYFENTSLQCVKCHQVNGKGSQLGPDLSQIGRTRSGEQLLNSIVYPNDEISKGYETRVLELDDGRVVIGIVQEQHEDAVVLADPDGKIETVELKSIEDQSRGRSAMPDNLANQISPFQLRDLIAYLQSLK